MSILKDSSCLTTGTDFKREINISTGNKNNQCVPLSNRPVGAANLSGWSTPKKAKQKPGKVVDSQKKNNKTIFFIDTDELIIGPLSSDEPDVLVYWRMSPFNKKKQIYKFFKTIMPDKKDPEVEFDEAGNIIAITYETIVLTNGKLLCLDDDGFYSPMYLDDECTWQESSASSKQRSNHARLLQNR